MFHNFFVLYFHFHSVQCVLKIYLEAYSMTHWLFRSVWFSFQIFVDFYVIFLLWFPVWVQCMRQYAVYDLRPFKYLEVCFKAQTMAYVLYVLYIFERRRQWHPTPVLLPGKSMDRGAWWAAVHGVAKSLTWPTDWTELNWGSRKDQKGWPEKGSKGSWMLQYTEHLNTNLIGT